ncbi:hypothetical protein EDD22DRAFT_850281 [Suillus occidentalis]|nr:hypothetical protein EDD22DRAFT_850281 [Suillus occidentalis]
MSNHDSASESESNKQLPVTADEAAVLQSYLEQWSSADALKQKHVLKMATTEARVKAPEIIIDKLRKKELLTKIENDTGAKPGSKEMMNHYTTQLNQLMASLLEEELEEARETAKEWNAKGVPAEIKDEESKVRVAVHDYNQDFGSAEAFMKSWNWTVIQPEWDVYTADALDENGFGHLMGKCCGNLKVSVPWKYVIPQWDKIIPAEYLPEGHSLAEPSKLRQIHATELLQFWYDQQEEVKDIVFMFIGWWDSDAQDVVLAADKDDSIMLWERSNAKSKGKSGGRSKQTTGAPMTQQMKGTVKAAKAKPAKGASASLAGQKNKERMSNHLSSEDEFNDNKTSTDEFSAKESDAGVLTSRHTSSHNCKDLRSSARRPMLHSKNSFPTILYSHLTSSNLDYSPSLVPKPEERQNSPGGPAGNGSNSEMESSEGSGTIRRQNASAKSFQVQMHDKLSTRDHAKKGLQMDEVKAAAKKDIEHDIGKAAPANRPKKGPQQDAGKAAAPEHHKKGTNLMLGLLPNHQHSSALLRHPQQETRLWPDSLQGGPRRNVLPKNL